MARRWLPCRRCSRSAVRPGLARARVPAQAPDQGLARGPARDSAPALALDPERAPARAFAHPRQESPHRPHHHRLPTAGPTALRTHTRGRAPLPASIESPSRNLPNSLLGTRLAGVLDVSSLQDSPAIRSTTPRHSVAGDCDVMHRTWEAVQEFRLTRSGVGRAL